MGRITNVGTGEIVDRLTILQLKLLHGSLAGADTTHFRNERNALLVRLTASNQFALWLEFGFELAAVNAALWAAEDEMREYRKIEGLHASHTYLYEITQCAFRIQLLNDQRAALIRTINEKVGENFGPEKLP